MLAADAFEQHDRFAEHFVAKGGTIVRAEARDIRFVEGVPKTVLTTAGEFGGDIVVLAAGAWSGDLARRLGAPVLLEAERVETADALCDAFERGLAVQGPYLVEIVI